MESQASALIIASACQLRDSSQVLLAAIPGIDHVLQAEDVPSALAMGVRHSPALVLLDNDLSGDELVAALRRIKAEWPRAPSIVLVDEEQGQQAAKNAGANVILIKGALASKVYAMAEDLLSGREN